MTHWTLKPYVQIEGISSVSGLHWRAPYLYLIADNSSYLYQYDIEQKTLHNIALNDHPQETIAKPLKYDVESLLFKDDTLQLFGSGSKPTRLQQFSYHLNTAQVSQKDLTQLYIQFRQMADLAEDELNIEGVVFIAEPQPQWWFFQRGNGAQARNGIFIVTGEQWATATDIEFIPLNLPAIQHCPSSFTDAVQVDDAVYFLAAAEDTQSTYEDGTVLGSLIGKINIDTKALEMVLQITNSHKFEGLTVFGQSSEQVTFLLGEDNDQHDSAITIYELVIAR